MRWWEEEGGRREGVWDEARRWDLMGLVGDESRVGLVWNGGVLDWE